MTRYKDRKGDGRQRHVLTLRPEKVSLVSSQDRLEITINMDLLPSKNEHLLKNPKWGTDKTQVLIQSKDNSKTDKAEQGEKQEDRIGGNHKTLWNFEPSLGVKD